MWGLEFREETTNSLVCAVATFEVRKRNARSKVYRVRQHPDIGIAIDQKVAGSWQNLKEHASVNEVEAILPDEFGHNWTYSDFLVAFTFWAEGYKNARRRR